MAAPTITEPARLIPSTTQGSKAGRRHMLMQHFAALDPDSQNFEDRCIEIFEELAELANQNTNDSSVESWLMALATGGIRYPGKARFEAREEAQKIANFLTVPVDVALVEGTWTATPDLGPLAR